MVYLQLQEQVDLQVQRVQMVLMVKVAYLQLQEQVDLQVQTVLAELMV